MNEHVDMFRHDYIGRQSDPILIPAFLHNIDYNLTRNVACQKREPSMSIEGDKPGAPIEIKVKESGHNRLIVFLGFYLDYCLI